MCVGGVNMYIYIYIKVRIALTQSEQTGDYRLLAHVIIKSIDYYAEGNSGNSVRV